MGAELGSRGLKGATGAPVDAGKLSQRSGKLPEPAGGALLLAPVSEHGREVSGPGGREGRAGPITAGPLTAGPTTAGPRTADPGTGRVHGERARRPAGLANAHCRRDRD